jgi:hypothetical protein
MTRSTAFCPLVLELSLGGVLDLTPRRAVLAMELAITAPRFCAVGALYRRAVLAMVLPV